MHHGDLITVRFKYMYPAYRSFDINRKVVAARSPKPLLVDIPMRFVGDGWKVLDYTYAS